MSFFFELNQYFCLVEECLGLMPPETDSGICQIYKLELFMKTVCVYHRIIATVSISTEVTILK